MPLPSPPFHEPEAIKHPVADGKEPSIGEILPVILGPNITGKLGIVSGSIYGASGAFGRNSDKYSRISASVVANAESGINFSASNSNSIYGDSTTVQPKSLIFNYVIKY